MIMYLELGELYGGFCMGELNVPGYDFFFWNYEEQTKMKHVVLADYLGVWMKKLGKYHNVDYFDCHGGCGAYYSNDGKIFYGSSVIASEIYKGNKEKIKNKMRVFAVEEDKKTYDNLKKVIEYKDISQIVTIKNGDYDKIVNDYIDKCNRKINPTFFFVDPFGFSLKMKTLEKIMSAPKCEVLVNFMYTQLNRFLENDNLKNNYNDLFGSDEWIPLCNLTGSEREEQLIGLFRKEAKKFAKYVFPYRMSFADKNRTYYYLIHLTNNIDGCTIMKSSFAKFNYGHVEYMGIMHGVNTIFDLKNVKTEQVKKFLVDKYSESRVKVSFNQIIESNIDSVPYLESEIRSALKELREEKLIRIIAVESKTKRGLSGEDIIEFY